NCILPSGSFPIRDFVRGVPKEIYGNHRHVLIEVFYTPLNHITYLNYFYQILREAIILFEDKNHISSYGIATRKSESIMIRW
ncbi:MAG: hypothetical protein ACXWL9_05670, partial [Syntrophales bacterium]